MQTDPRPFDPMCNRYADEIPEVVEGALEADVSPDDFAREDGTFNPETGHFLCTECYIRAGMPATPGGWKCP